MFEYITDLIIPVWMTRFVRTRVQKKWEKHIYRSRTFYLYRTLYAIYDNISVDVTNIINVMFSLYICTGVKNGERERLQAERGASATDRRREREREDGGTVVKTLRDHYLPPFFFFLFVCVCACLFFFLSVCMYVCLSHSIFENMTIPVKKKIPKTPP